MHLTNVTSCYLIRVTSLDIGFGRKTITWRKVKDNNVTYFRQTVAKFKFQPLNDSGVTYMEGDILTFRYFQCESGTSVPFDFDVVSDDGIAGSFSIDEALFGVLNRKFSASLLSGDGNNVGQITAELNVIKPLVGFEDQFCKSGPVWNPEWTSLEVGHRGAGNSHLDDKSGNSDVLENTILSFNTAALHGADCVEFDVQLCEDLIPVLSHDFIARDWRRASPDPIPVSKLKLSDLHSGQVTNSKDTEVIQPRIGENLYPTLEDVFSSVDPKVAFNVEIKYGMLLRIGTEENPDPMEINLYLDKILEVVFSCAKKRPVMFSCFHPDVTVALRMKQSKYPVFQLQGENKEDARMDTVKMAATLAKAFDLTGVVVWAESLMKDPENNVKAVRDKSLQLFTFTGNNSTREYVEALKALQLDGVIFDRMNHYHPEEIGRTSYVVIQSNSDEKLLSAKIELKTCFNKNGFFTNVYLSEDQLRVELCRRTPKIVIEIDWDELSTKQMFDVLFKSHNDFEDSNGETTNGLASETKGLHKSTVITVEESDVSWPQTVCKAILEELGL